MGYSREELLTKTFQDITHPDDLETDLKYVQQMLAGEIETYCLEKRYICKEGSLVWINLTVSLVCDDMGKPEHFISVVEDITERKKAVEEKLLIEQQFQQTQKLESLGVLAGGIAHDFNNILTVIICNCSLVQQRPETAVDLIPEIEVAAARAAELCRQMLVYAGKSLSILKRFNMTALTEDVLKMLKSIINQNVVIKSNFPSEELSIIGDASQIRQIVMNLVINASEAIDGVQGEIQVSMTEIEISASQLDSDYIGKAIEPGRYICLKVSDSGCGMDDETKKRIFEPFYTTKFTGRGLGMSAVLGIITAHKGALQLFSQPGQGTTFKIYLPAQKRDSAEKNILQVSPTAWQGSGTVLLVEDEIQIMQVAKALMEALGFSVIEAINGKEALELYQKNAEYIRLVVTDLGMPVMDGYELFHELKKINKNLPIIVSSGFGAGDISSRITEGEVAGFLSKPYNFDQICNVLKGVVES